MLDPAPGAYRPGMSTALRRILEGKRLLLVVAAEGEARAVRTGLGAPGVPVEWALDPCTSDVDLLRTGIGKANAAGAVAAFLDPARHGAVLSAGIAGALPVVQAQSPGPGGFAAELGEVLVSSRCVFADEGLMAPAGFTDCAGLGFPIGPFEGSGVPVDARVLAALSTLGRVAPVATVSTCSGTDVLARHVAVRTGAAAEAMEGAAVALVALRRGVPAGEVRVVSNTTGDRPAQRWNASAALERLGDVIGRLAGVRP